MDPQESLRQIDLMFTMDADLLRSVGCEDPGLSDHISFLGS